MTPGETLELADWRRQVADLYARVRAIAATDPEAAWNDWRATRERLFREHSQSPVLPAERAAFRARHWPYDPSLRMEGIVEAEPEPAPAPIATPALAFGSLLPISTGGEEGMARLGTVRIPFPDRERTLTAFWMSGYAGGLFLPFRDGTSGAETYGAGRYLLDTAKSADLGPGRAPNTLVLDFNFAFQPSCAFDPKWACPLAPPENRLDIRIEAGERID